MRVAAVQKIEISPGQAFRLLADLERCPEYSKAVVDRRKLDDSPVGLGTRFHAVDRWPGQTVEFTVEITAYEPDTFIAAAWSEPMAGGWQAQFQPDGSGTEIRFEAWMNPSGMLGLLSPVMRFWAQKETRTFLARFKQWAEQQSSQLAS
ncbi:MAG TPA: SRPBCC family protein [Dehalococcoidia bacterium]|jgi:uncharacterized protein YndB with AHSA1/START domain|nr:SRPBCC family protein [Dehalococcoidia bacterium]